MKKKTKFHLLEREELNLKHQSQVHLSCLPILFYVQSLINNVTDKD